MMGKEMLFADVLFDRSKTERLETRDCILCVNDKWWWK